MTLEEKIFYERLDAKEEGRVEEKLAFVKRMLERGMTEKEVCDIANCDIEYIRKIQNDVKEV